MCDDVHFPREPGEVASEIASILRKDISAAGKADPSIHPQAKAGRM